MRSIGLTIGILMAIVVVGQEDFKEQLIVPLSTPGSKGKLEVGQVRGDITVIGYEGKEVIIDAYAKGGDDCKGCKEKPAPAGMKRINSSSVEFGASENNNSVEVETNSWKKAIDLTIKVPKNFDLEVSTVHGKISITGVSGTMEVSAVHGPLTLKDIKGSVLCNTVHGDVIANFLSVAANEPMSFVTLHGNVDVTFPAGVKATAKMKTDRGEIFTDFDITVDNSKPEVNSKSGEYRVSINKWIYGKINGGGPEVTFKNMSGDIYIRKK